MKYILTLFITLILWSCSTSAQENSSKTNPSKKEIAMKKTDAYWKEILTPEQYHILREKGTDRPGNGGYTKHFEKGTYICAACKTQLFESGSKYESHCGWPSFDDAIEGTVAYTPDNTLGMRRIEITCQNCDGHLGHIFDDGPRETTGKRYCVNSTSIEFVAQEKK